MSLSFTFYLPYFSTCPPFSEQKPPNFQHGISTHPSIFGLGEHLWRILAHQPSLLAFNVIGFWASQPWNRLAQIPSRRFQIADSSQCLGSRFRNGGWWRRVIGRRALETGIILGRESVFGWLSWVGLAGPCWRGDTSAKQGIRVGIILDFRSTRCSCLYGADYEPEGPKMEAIIRHHRRSCCHWCS